MKAPETHNTKSCLAAQQQSEALKLCVVRKATRVRTNGAKNGKVLFFPGGTVPFGSIIRHTV